MHKPAMSLRSVTSHWEEIMMFTRILAVSTMAIGMAVSGLASAGALETNLSGVFYKGEHAQINVTGFGNAGFNFKLAAGNITPGQGCVNGRADCLSVWGWATRSDDPNQFLYANENGQCAFYIRNEADAIVVHGLRGDCGTDDMNHRALKSVNGIYKPGN